MKFGLIGYPLTHSYSKSYFTQKFRALGLDDFSYDNFPLARIEEVSSILESDVLGLNVTLPYKTAIIDYLHEVDPAVKQIGAVNTLVRTVPNKWKGFNTDVTGFRESLLKWIGNSNWPQRALILGSGGSSKAVAYVLEGLGIKFKIVSRKGHNGLTYNQLSGTEINSSLLIINTTSLGMAPEVTTCPDIPYDHLTPEHWLFDLVYNPANTLFLTRGLQQGAKTKNGLEMLHLQAEHAWEIWKSYGKF